MKKILINFREIISKNEENRESFGLEAVDRYRIGANAEFFQYLLSVSGKKRGNGFEKGFRRAALFWNSSDSKW